MTRLAWRLRHWVMRRAALVDALEEAYQDCTRLRRERDVLVHKLYLARVVNQMPRSIP